jgi:hypothetical protein
LREKRLVPVLFQTSIDDVAVDFEVSLGNPSVITHALSEVDFRP